MLISDPLVTGVKEIAVTGPHSPTIHSIDDLSGQEVFVRKSSSYWEHLEALNPRFKSQGKAPVKLRAAPEDLEDEPAGDAECRAGTDCGNERVPSKDVGNNLYEHSWQSGRGCG